MTKTILIAVRNGLAEVEYAPEDCEVMIIDFDTYGQEGGEEQNDIERLQDADLPSDIKTAMISEIESDLNDEYINYL
jgi:hypothetical protein